MNYRTTFQLISKHTVDLEHATKLVDSTLFCSSMKTLLQLNVGAPLNFHRRAVNISRATKQYAYYVRYEKKHYLVHILWLYQYHIMKTNIISKISDCQNHVRIL